METLNLFFFKKHIFYVSLQTETVENLSNYKNAEKMSKCFQSWENVHKAETVEKSLPKDEN